MKTQTLPTGRPSRFQSRPWGADITPAGLAKTAGHAEANTPENLGLLTAREKRLARLLPGGVPRYVRCYDNGGHDAPDGSFDRYTVCFTGRAGSATAPGYGRWYSYRAMSSSPYSPQGVGMWGSTQHHPADYRPGCWAGPSIGRRCHLGVRIRFQDLPEDCRRLVLSDYREIWKLDQEGGK